MSLLGDKITINYTSGMKNETKKKAGLQKSQQAVQAQREQNPHQESTPSNYARRLSTLKPKYQSYYWRARCNPDNGFFHAGGGQILHVSQIILE